MQDYIYFIIWMWTFKNPFHINILWELLNLEMNNSTVNFTTPETSTNYTTQSIASLKWLEIFLDSICFLFGLPTHSYVIWIIVRGTGSGVASEFFNLNLSVCEIANSLTGLISALSVHFSSLLTLSIFFQGVSITGRPLFQCLMYVERYLAVVHPVIFLKNKPLRYRVICCTAAWIITLGSCVSCILTLVLIIFYIYACVTPPPGSTPSYLVLAPCGSRTRDSGTAGGRSNKERPSVARAPLFEIRRVRFTHSPYWHTSVTLA